jgi:pilus assembly protein Flp/PilA
MINLIKKVANKLGLPQNEQGQGLVEYALILVLIAVVVIAVLLTLGPAISDVYTKAVCGLQGGTCAGPYVWDTDIFLPLSDACAEVGLELNTGREIYVYGEKLPWEHDMEFWLTTKNEAPKPGFQYLFTVPCE